MAHAAGGSHPAECYEQQNKFWSSDRRHLATRTNTSVVVSSLHDHDRGQAEGVWAAIEVDPRLATRSGLFDHPANAVLVHAEHCLDHGHRGHHHEVAGAEDAVKLVHFFLVWIKLSMAAMRFRR